MSSPFLQLGLLGLFGQGCSSPLSPGLDEDHKWPVSLWHGQVASCPSLGMAVVEQE